MTDPNAPISITPNVVIEDPAKRRAIGKWLYIVGLVVALVALFFAFFPEFGGDWADRAVQFLNSALLLLSAGFGLSVVTPNTPRA